MLPSLQTLEDRVLVDAIRGVLGFAPLYKSEAPASARAREYEVGLPIHDDPLGAFAPGSAS